VFPNPDRFDIGRDAGQHLAFGLGNHYCLGASLARLEAEVTLEGLIRRFPDFSGTAEPPSWKPSVVLRGPTALPLGLGTRAWRLPSAGKGSRGG
jgi:cytochrome P450 family 107 subfamily K polypeptide 1